MADKAARIEPDAALPESLDEIRRVAGTTAMLALVESWGGTVVHIPQKYTPDHPLVAIVGHRAAVDLIRYYDGQRVYLARACAAARAARDAEIRRRHSGGTAVRDLALEYHLSERQIWNILAAGSASAD
ncbi:Mor transcription activator family protein, partial [Ralstonia sp.]|uniref:Mor transcription activator family protein n=1 Tax=Ralstonia sp. TaxID=54061 RepID=UPI0039791D68